MPYAYNSTWVPMVLGGQQSSSDMTSTSIFPTAGSQQFSKEIEDEANSYFQRIYNHPPHPTISIDEVLEMLKRFKDSPIKKERVCTSICYFSSKFLV